MRSSDDVIAYSKAGEALCTWAVNIISFYDVFCDAVPQRIALAAAEAQLTAAQDKLAKSMAEIDRQHAAEAAGAVGLGAEGGARRATSSSATIALAIEKAAIEQESVAAINTAVSAKAKSCSAALARAEPALAAAEAALSTLNKNNLTELRSFSRLPGGNCLAVVGMIMCVMAKGKVPPEKSRTWKEFKLRMRSAEQFLEDLVTFDKENIPAENVKEAKKYLKGPDCNGGYVVRRLPAHTPAPKAEKNWKGWQGLPDQDCLRLVAAAKQWDVSEARYNRAGEWFEGEIDVSEWAGVQEFDARAGLIVKLSLSGLVRLQSLPDGLCGLARLKELSLRDCASLIALPDAIAGMVALQVLDLTYCESLTTLPATIGKLRRLNELILENCTSLTSLPDAVGQLGKLETFNLRYCDKLRCLPDSIGRLASAKVLDLSWCGSLACLPETMGGLVGLQELSLYGCTQLACLPDSMRRMAGLETLWLNACPSLTSLPDCIAGMVRLQRLGLTDCTAAVRSSPVVASLESRNVAVIVAFLTRSADAAVQ